MNPDKGYNNCTGGQHAIPSESVRKLLSENTKKLWRDAEFRNSVISKLQGHTVSEETRNKISLANSKPRSVPSKLKGRKLSEEHKMKLKSYTPWNKGLTKHNSSIIASAAIKMQGRKVSMSGCKNISAAHKAWASCHPQIWVHNSNQERFIESSQLQKFLDNGYVTGRLNTLDTYIHKGDITKKINHSDTKRYIDSGWSLGKSEACNASIKKSKQKYVWVLDDTLEFSSSYEICQYLRCHGYPKFVPSTVTHLYNVGFNSSSVYNSLQGRITRYENKTYHTNTSS